MKLQIKGLLVVFALLLGGCGTNTPGRSIEQQSLSGAQYSLLEAGTLIAEKDSISGTGKLIFTAPLPEEDNRFSLGFSLKDSGSITLSSNTNASLQNGVNITFGRTGSQLTVALNVGNETYDLSSDFAPMDASGAVSLELEIHGHGHVMAWVNGEKFEYAFTTRVPGKLWGLALHNAVLTKAQASAAEEEG